MLFIGKIFILYLYSYTKLTSYIRYENYAAWFGKSFLKSTCVLMMLIVLKQIVLEKFLNDITWFW